MARFLLAAAWIDGLTYLSGGKPLVEDDSLLSAIFGGVLIGLGVGLFFKSKATTGGSDVISMILGRYSKIPVGQLMIMVDSAIVLLGFVTVMGANMILGEGFRSLPDYDSE